MNENERAAVFAALMLEVIQERHGFSDEEMKLCAGLALEVQLKAEAGNADALAIMLHRVEYLQGIWHTIIEARRAKLDKDTLN